MSALEKTTYEEDWDSGSWDLIKAKTNIIFMKLFTGSELDDYEQQYFDDYTEGKQRRKPGSPKGL